MRISLQMYEIWPERNWQASPQKLNGADFGYEIFQNQKASEKTQSTLHSALSLSNIFRFSQSAYV